LSHSGRQHPLAWLLSPVVDDTEAEAAVQVRSELTARSRNVVTLQDDDLLEEVEEHVLEVGWQETRLARVSVERGHLLGDDAAAETLDVGDIAKTPDSGEEVGRLDTLSVGSEPHRAAHANLFALKRTAPTWDMIFSKLAAVVTALPIPERGRARSCRSRAR
jgi:hypothetical protein